VSNKNFVTNLAVVMKNRKITRKDLSEMTGVSPNIIGMWFGFKSKPSFNSKEKVCSALNITIELMENDTIKELPKQQIDYTPVDKRLANNLPLVMTKHCMTVAELSRRSGIAKSTINKYIAGTTSTPTLGTVGCLARALGVSVGTLLN